MSTSNPRYMEVVRMSYAWFADKVCTPEKLEEFLDGMKLFLAETGVSREEAYEDLEHRHTITILDSSFILEDSGDHEEWFNPSTNVGLRRNIEWHFWSHYRDYVVTSKGWPKGVIDSLDRETSLILSHIEDPLRLGTWDTRGMVMGSIQSGKTANYSALICKAIDAGYKLIIVLAGVHNSLRSQTQYRLNEEILGYDMDKVQKFSGQAESIGVRALFHNQHDIVQTLTSSNEKGDFIRSVANRVGIVPSKDGPATILVIKKHVTILKNLTDWATMLIGQKDDTGRRVVAHVPILVIDDECDYASVNTQKVVLDENGLVDEECDPAKTNMRIRELLNSFNKSIYIGYTATPFANIFISHKQKHARYGEDLFPRNFIISLPQPTNYIGPERVFGLVEHSMAGISAKEPADLVRYIEDSDELIPAKHKKDLIVPRLPESLEHSIKTFLICCAIRRTRQSLPVHDSMLVHVTRFTNVQKQIKILVEQSLQKYVNRIRSGSDSLDDFREIWERDFIPTTMSMEHESDSQLHDWDEIVENLYPVAGRVKVNLINGLSTDSLLYRDAEMATKQRLGKGEDVPWEEQGVHVIAIGGDKLSRGLTLDGLTVSYYLRASRMYDTLMQMGRWFGYRDGYLDACRIYTTQELAEWFQFIASASLELRQELEYMALINEEPRSFGLKVLNHPGQLAITSAGKRQNTEEIALSFSGRISETICFDLNYSESNLMALTELLKFIESEGEPVTGGPEQKLHWKNVGPDTVIRYLRSYHTETTERMVVDPDKMADFIETQINHGNEDLTQWNVAVITRKDAPTHKFMLSGEEVGCIERKPKRKNANFLSIGRLVSPSDEWIDFSDEEKRKARAIWKELLSQKGREPDNLKGLPSGPAMRAARPKERGLLLVYPICYGGSDPERYGTEDGKEVTGFAISFPNSGTTKEVNYVVNSVFQDAED